MADQIEREVKNLVFLQRFANGLSRNGRARFRQMLDEITAALVRHDPTSVITRYRRARLEKALEALADATGRGYADIDKAWSEALTNLGVNQAKHVEDLLRAAGVPVTGATGRGAARTVVREAVIDGRTLSEWMSSAQASFLAATTRAVRIGVEQDDAVSAIIGMVRGDAARQARRHIDGIARTSTTAITNRNHLRVYEANADVLEGVQFLATLDSRTTLVCARWDGTVWAVDDPAIQKPPLHFNCRSQLVPIVDWGGLGIKPPEDGARASDSGPTRAKTYEEWFGRQSADKQDAIIGAERGKLFRRGSITFRDMVTRDNRVVPLDRLS